MCDQVLTKRWLPTCKFAISAVLFCLLWAMPRTGLLAGTVDARRHGFTLDLPSGFTQRHDLNTPPEILYTFSYDELADEGLGCLLFIQQLPELIGQENITREDFPPDFKGAVSSVEWSVFELSACEVPTEAEGRQFVTYSVQIPIVPKAIQITLFGPAGRKAELKDLLSKVVFGVKGQTNWIGSLAGGPAGKVSKAYITAMFIIWGIALLAALVLFWVVSKKLPRGVLFLIAVVIYSAGMRVPISQVPLIELLFLSSFLKLLGVVGGILGLIDFFRKRKPKQARQKADVADQLGGNGPQA